MDLPPTGDKAPVQGESKDEAAEKPVAGEQPTPKVTAADPASHQHEEPIVAEHDHEDIPSFDEWKKQTLAEEEKKQANGAFEAFVLQNMGLVLVLVPVLEIKLNRTMNTFSCASASASAYFKH